MPGLYLKLIALPPLITDWAAVSGNWPEVLAPRAVIRGELVLGPLNISILSPGNILMRSTNKVTESAQGRMVKPGQVALQRLRI